MFSRVPVDLSQFVREGWLEMLSTVLGFYDELITPVAHATKLLKPLSTSLIQYFIKFTPRWSDTTWPSLKARSD